MTSACNTGCANEYTDTYCAREQLSVGVVRTRSHACLLESVPAREGGECGDDCGRMELLKLCTFDP